MNEKLLKYLLEKGLLTPENAAAVREKQLKQHCSLRDILAESGLITEEQLLEAYTHAEGYTDADHMVLEKFIVGKEVGAGRPMRGYQYTKGFAVICPSVTFCTLSCTSSLLRQLQWVKLLLLNSPHIRLRL